MNLTRQFFACALPLALASCGGDESRDSLPNWSEGYEGADGGTNDGEGEGEVEGPMSLATVDDIGIPARIQRRDGFAITDQDCAIDIDGTREGLQEIFCQMEFNELDLAGYGLTFDFHVPAGACEWIEYWHYQYEKFEVGFGPAMVSYTIDANGNYKNEINSVDGKPRCSYDYSGAGEDFPNCCLGTYVLTVTYEETGEVKTFPAKDWGGKPSECHDGAAYADDEASLDEDGWPTSKLVFVHRDAFHKRFELGSGALDYRSNVVFANYYDPADHPPGGSPASLTYRPGFNRVVPYYNFYCYDHAEEVLGSIRMVVREWNEEKEFDVNGDPDTDGTEPSSFPEINDILDWKDLTPDSTTWVGDND